MICIVALMMAVFGVFMLLSSPDRLINTAKRSLFGRMLPFPQEGTVLWKLLIGFYRFIGVVALSLSAFSIVMLIFQLTRGQ